MSRKAKEVSEISQVYLRPFTVANLRFQLSC